LTRTNNTKCLNFHARNLLYRRLLNHTVSILATVYGPQGLHISQGFTKINPNPGKSAFRARVLG
jgi:hypothetical protein